MPTMTAQMAGLRRVGRVNQHERHTSRLRFVCHKLPQLVERPTVVAVALRLADLRALANTRQIFEGNLPLRGLGRCDNLRTDRVVDRAHMALLSAREPLQKPCGFFRAFALERAPDFGIARTKAVDLRGFVGMGIRIDGHTAPAKINAQCPSRRVGRRSRAFERDMSAKATSVASSSVRCSAVGTSLQASVRIVSIKGTISHTNVTYKGRLKPGKRFLVWG